MTRMTRRLSYLALASLVSVALAGTAAAKGDKFSSSEDATQKDEPQEFLKDYDKLVKGSEADWVYFTASPKEFKKVAIKPFGTTNRNSRSKMAAEQGDGYLEQWIKRSKKLGWEIVKSGADLTIEGNVFNAWEPSGAARFWGGWMANPGCGIEVMAKDAKGNIVFQIRNKSKGSTIDDAVENGLEKVVETLEMGK